MYDSGYAVLINCTYETLQACDVTLEQYDLLNLARGHDESESVWVRSKVEADLSGVFAEKCADSPGAYAALRSSHEEHVVPRHHL